MEDIRARLAEALAGTHDIERELGGGGMSRTYLATERNFRRRVVVKVLAPELIAGISFERFHREILLAAQLQHPHIVPVLTAGETAGLPWFTMPYVDGQSLRKRLDDGPLPVNEAVSVLRDVARALAYAHAQGVVHRDIKPDNVLLSSGTATVTDFGIAKALTAARTDSGEGNTTLTIAGTSLGTPAYMSPEQVTGDADSDHRADFYSFGAMAYELLTGRAPFQAPTASKVLAAHMTATPEDIRALRADTPPQLAALVMSCLEKSPDDRPQHAADLLRVLDTVTASGDLPQVPAVLIGGRVRLGRAVALWAAATAAVAVTAWAATEVIGLPDWVLPGSVAVMFAGLPVILMTAYVQRIAHRAFTATPQRTPGGRGAPAAHGTLATLALKASPHVSWRRTWLGGTVAVAGFGLLVLGFMVTRALGIGPAASLRGTGAFGERETIVIADFRSPAGDSTLGTTVSEALRTDLAQSKSLSVLTRAGMRELLALMQRPQEGMVSFDLAREIATREGAKAVLDGSIVQLGPSYVISARLVAALDGAELAVFRQTADGEAELIDALGRLSRAVRERAGEPLKAIRASSALERVTTPSLPALRKYVEGTLKSSEGGDPDRARALLREAVELDTAFAMAWRSLATMTWNQGNDRQAAITAISAAYRHRDRLTEMERLLTEGTYFLMGPEPDLSRALGAYQLAARLDPTSSTALNNAAAILTIRRDHVQAESLFMRTVALPRTFGGAYVNLIETQAVLGKVDALDSTVAAFRARFPNHQEIWEAEASAAWGRGEIQRYDSIVQAGYRAGQTSQALVRGAQYSSAIAYLEGRPSDGLAWATRASEASQRAAPSAATRFAFAIDTAYYHAFGRGDAEAAHAALRRGEARDPIESISPTDRPWRKLAQLAAGTGDAALARRAQAGFERDLVAAELVAAGQRAFYGAMVAMAEGRWDESVTLMREADAQFGLDEDEAAAYLGYGFEQGGNADSAIATYERFLKLRARLREVDARWLPQIHRSLGALYEARGDTKRAAEQYGAVLELWQDAEPAMQPQVRDVRGRLAGVAGR